MAYNGVKTSEWGGTNDFLVGRNFNALPMLVLAKGVVAGADGRKIIPTGTIVGSVANPLLVRDTKLEVLTATNILTMFPRGIVLGDIEVTDRLDTEAVTGAVVYKGVVDISHLINYTVLATASAKESAMDVQFINGGRE